MSPAAQVLQHECYHLRCKKNRVPSPRWKISIGGVLNFCLQGRALCSLAVGFVMREDELGLLALIARVMFHGTYHSTPVLKTNGMKAVSLLSEG